MSEFSRTVLAVGAAGPFAGFVPPALARRGKESERLCMTQHRPILYDNEAPLKLLSETCVTETGKNPLVSSHVPWSGVAWHNETGHLFKMMAIIMLKQFDCRIKEL